MGKHEQDAARRAWLMERPKNAVSPYDDFDAGWRAGRQEGYQEGYGVAIGRMMDLLDVPSNESAPAEAATSCERKRNSSVPIIHGQDVEVKEAIV